MEFITLGISAIIAGVFAVLYVMSRRRSDQTIRHQQTALAALQQEVELLQQKSLETQDPVTQLSSWKFFEDRVSYCLKECSRYRFTLGVLYVDIDEFNLINHAMGTEAGNQLLQAAAERLQSCLRQIDSISRQNKDTFVILLNQLTRQETAAIIIQRIMQAMLQPFVIGQQELNITICLGAAFYPNDGDTAGHLLKNAEYAMLQAKQKGKQICQYYQEKLYQDSQYELALYNSFSSDEFLDELTLMYQPIMNRQTQAMFCIETQITWQHPRFGTISAKDIYAYAEKHKKLNKITERVLVEAGKKFQYWQTLGLKPQRLGVKVHLKQLESVQFVHRISQILQQQKIEPQHLLLEVSGEGVTASLDILEKSFNMLQYMGVKIALGESGFGGISLRYLKAFPVSYLKLDEGVIGDIVSNEKTRHIMRAMIAFAEKQSLMVITEGVESDEQAAVLSDLGIVLMQGHLMSKPLSESEMTDKMAQD